MLKVKDLKHINFTKTNIKIEPWLRAAQTHTGIKRHNILSVCYCDMIPLVVDTSCVTVSSVQL